MPDMFPTATQRPPPAPRKALASKPVQGPVKPIFNTPKTTWYTPVRPTPRPEDSTEPITPDPNVEGVTWYTLEDGSMIPGEGTYIDIVAQNMWAVIECANNIDAIIAAPGHAQDAANSAADAASSASDAADYWKTFNSMWYGPFPSAPMLDPFGGAPTQGDVYFDTTTNTVMVYNNFNTWVPITGLVPSGAIIQGTPPTASPGALWWDSVGGQLYVRYDDGSGPAQWVAASNVLAGGGAAGFLPVAGGTMLGSLELIQGTATATAVHFGGLNTGFYGNAADNGINASISGTNRFSLLGDRLTVNVPVREADGSAALPSFTFLNEITSGLYRNAAGLLGMAASGLDVMQWRGSDKATLAFGPVLLAANAVANLEAVTKQQMDAADATKIGDAPNDGLQYVRQSQAWSVSTAGLADAPNNTNAYGRLGGAWATVLPTAGGTLTGSVTISGAASVLGLPAGATTATSINFGTGNTGLYGPTTNTVGIVTNGTARFNVTNALITCTLPFRQNAGTAASPQYSFTTDTSSGIYRSAANTISMSTAGIETMRWDGSNNSTTALGPLLVSGNPTAALQVAPKQYVDALTTGASALSPLMNGVAAVGTSLAYSREDHVHASDTTRAPLVSPSFTGTPLAPTATTGTSTTQIATTAFVGASMSAAGAITEAPSDSQYYSRRNAAWAVSPGGLVDAPNNTNAYGRLGGAWATVLPTAGGTLTGVLAVPAGAVGTPSLIFTGGSTNAGLYSTGTGSAQQITTSINGVLRFAVTQNFLTLNSQTRGIDGTSAAPTYAFQNNTNSGLYRSAANVITMSGSTGDIMSWVGATNTTQFLGPALLAADPTLALQATTKQYVDARTTSPAAATPLMDGTATVGVATLYAREDHIHPTDTSRASVASVPVASATTPVMDGTATIGVGTTWARADHIHPTDTSRASVASVPLASSTTPAMDSAAAVGVGTTWARADHVHPTDTTRAPLANPSLTGTPLAPTATAGTSTTQIATTAFVANAVAATVATVIIASTPPAVTHGAMYWDSTGGQLYIGYNDGNSTAWIAASNAPP
jgi:hypothetical protein